MFNNKVQKPIIKEIKDLTGKEELALSLMIGVKQVSPKKYEITITHPNTKEKLYYKVHIAKSFNEAFEIGKKLKMTKFASTNTWYTEIVHIPRPKRGKVKLKTRESENE
jgi:hypothetical protein